LIRAEEKFNYFGNYLYEYKLFSLDTACCGGKPNIGAEEIINAKKRNLERINLVKKYSRYFIVSNCGSVWFPPPP
jgi:hypothetical protein